MAEEPDRPFSRPFQGAEALERLKARLPRARRAVAGGPEHAEADRPEAEPRRPTADSETGDSESGGGEAAAESARGERGEEADADFPAEMEAMGVSRLAAGPERVERREGAGRKAAAEDGTAPSARAKPRLRSERRGPEDGFDGTTPRLDLHGLSPPDALSELRRHLAAWRAAGLSKVRVVTGRGAHSGDGRAAVREAVEDWLGRAPGVAAAYRAKAEAGGDGVLLVELVGRGRRRGRGGGSRS